MFFYADDSCVIVDAETEEELNEKVETTINKIAGVFMKLGLTINQKKSEIMPMKGTKTKKEFMVKDFKCKPCKEIVFLGACIQSDLGVKGQVDRVLSKMQKAIYKVNQQRFNRQGRERAAMIQAYVMSRLQYETVSNQNSPTKTVPPKQSQTKTVPCQNSPLSKQSHPKQSHAKTVPS